MTRACYKQSEVAQKEKPMDWYQVRTKEQRESLMAKTLISIARIQKLAKQKGILEPLSIGSTPVVMGSYHDRHELFVLRNGSLSHELCYRDGLLEEWVIRKPTKPNEKALRKIIPLCGITPESIKAIEQTLKLHA